MKRSRKISVAIGTLVVAGLAICALAGYLLSNGDVNPDIGWKNETIFTYTVSYARSPGEDPPDILVLGFWGGQEAWREMMYIAAVGEIVVDYWYATTLDKNGQWSFKFQVINGGLSPEYLGPWVYTRP